MSAGLRNRSGAIDPLLSVVRCEADVRGTSLNGSFTEAHILATTQAICDYRKSQGISGPVMLGKDTHALSAAAEQTALEVLAANGVEVVMQEQNGFTPTPGISHAMIHGRLARRR